MLFSFFATRGQLSAHILPTFPTLKDSLRATSWFLDLEWNLLYLCKINRWSPVLVRKRGCSPGDAISVRLSVRKSFCLPVCANADLPSSPYSQVWITREQSPKSPIIRGCSKAENLLCQNLLQYPPTSLSLLIYLFLSFLSICFDICSFSLPESDTEDTKRHHRTETHRNNNFILIVIWGTTIIEYSITLGQDDKV